MGHYRKTPTVLQLEAAECGAASLAMILARHGRNMGLDELRLLCGVSRDGTKASSLLRAARSLGFEAKGLKAEPEQIGALPLPLVAFVNFNHFLVIDAIDDRYVWLVDPATGRRRQTREEFAEGFTGVVLTFVPGPEFQRGDDRPSLVQSLISRFDGLRIALLFVALTALALVIPGIVLPVFARIFVDYILVRSLASWLWPLLIGMAITAAVRFMLLQLQEQALLRVRTAMTLTTAETLMRTLMALPVAFFEQRFAGEIADRVRLNEALGGLLTGQLAQAAANLVSAGFFLVVLLLYHWPLTLALIVLAAFNAAVLMASNRLLSERYRKISIDRGKLVGARVAGLKDIETFKASGAEDMLFARWTDLAISVQNGEQQAARLAAWVQPMPGLISGLITVVILAGGGFAVMRGGMTLGELVGYQTLAASFVAPVAALAGFGAELQQIRSWTGRLDDIFEQAPDPRLARPDPAVDDDVPRGHLQLRDLSFGYAPLDPPLITGLSLDVAPGERIALVGASGSGKSTIGKLIAGLAHPSREDILLDGRALADWPRVMLAHRVAYVRQDVMLFEGSIRDNLTLWDPALSEPDMLRAARDAMIHDVIASRPGGYDAQVVQSASNFSGGERQRLEIARALASDPALVILDEATSALDPVTEHGVMEAIRRRGIGCIIIAHRLSAIRDCDRILVLDQGQLVEMGNHNELMAQQGRYARLVEA